MIVKIISFYICFKLVLVSCLQMKSSTSSVDTISSSSPGSLLSIRSGAKLGSHRSIFNAISWPVRMSFMKFVNPSMTATGEEKTRPIGIESLVMPPARRFDDFKEELEKDDQNMKMKLFRLMYESVRDSDLKVKRAELIKKNYDNSSVFEIGYLLGDVTDKFNIMMDMEKTLKRLSHDWKPIEHINAYEQIANLAIDVGHVVDMLRGVEKKLPETKEEGEGPTTSSNTTPPPSVPDRRN